MTQRRAASLTSTPVVVNYRLAVLSSGRVQVYRMKDDGTAVKLATLPSWGDFIAMSALLLGNTASTGRWSVAPYTQP